MLTKLKLPICFGRSNTDSYIDMPDNPGLVFILGNLAFKVGKSSSANTGYREPYSFALLLFLKKKTLYTEEISPVGVAYSKLHGWELF